MIFTERDQRVMLLTARRSRKYRVDLVVHFVEPVASGNPEAAVAHYRIACTRYTVREALLTFVDEPVTCIACIAASTREAT